MLFRLIKNYCFFLLPLLATSVLAQSIPESEENFFDNLVYSNQLPARLLSGRSLLFYHHSFSEKELTQVQKSFAETGIDAVSAISLETLLGGYDVRHALFRSLQKREISNLVLLKKEANGYSAILTRFDGKPTFISNQQAAWKTTNYSLGEMLLQLKREALTAFKSQNLLINEQPETDLALRIITGSRIEGFTSDLRVDRVAVRLSQRTVENDRLKEVCKLYPFKLEFVEDSLTDTQLRAKGYWYVLSSLHAREQQVRAWLEYAPAKNSAPPLYSLDQQASSTLSVYKFYFKKLEFDNIYLGKQWDGAPTWEEALSNFIDNLRKELNIR